MEPAAAIREAVGALDDPRHIRALAVVGMGMEPCACDLMPLQFLPTQSQEDIGIQEGDHSSASISRTLSMETLAPRLR